jgi:mono/diheme cytochrome c family protein
MAIIRIIAALAVVCVVVVAAFVAFAWRSPIDPINRPETTAFDPTLVTRGAQLASAGNCMTCHTLPGGRAFAGGVAVATPFGNLYSTNITPDAGTGIGAWSQAAFARAMREGIDRAGRHLYPAFPYDHFTLLKDDDLAALYAFFMTREPVHATSPANELAFPFNQRLLIAGWKLLFFRSGPYKPDPAHSASWNRGAYLVEGLAHCSACHTPRNLLGAETRHTFAGGDAEGWTAYALNSASPAPVPWDTDALHFYLRNGWHSDHGIARGPMAPVINNLDAISDADLGAVVSYFTDILGKPSEERCQAARALLERVRADAGNPSGTAENARTAAQAPSPEEQTPGARIYQSACAPCHESGRPLPFGGINLALSTGPSGPNARNVLNVVLWGLPAADGERAPIMPAFAGSLNDRQLTELLKFVRAQFGAGPPWSGIENDIREARSGRRPVMISPAHGSDAASAIASQGDTR